MQSSGSLTCFISFEATVAEASLRLLQQVDIDVEFEPKFSEVAVRLDRASSISELDGPDVTKNRWELQRYY